MRAPILSALLACALVAACGSATTSPFPYGGALDVGGTDAGDAGGGDGGVLPDEDVVDDAVDDASEDPAEDAGADAADDAGADAADDGGADGAADTGDDTTTDTGEDTTTDAGDDTTTDTGDDTTTDTTTDASDDTTTDTGEDTTTDAGDDTTTDAGDDTTTDAGPVCGNGVREAAELCDGDDLGALTCATLGYDDGALGCGDDCLTLDTSACTSVCTPACGGLDCGPDPVCGISCGTCDDGSSCNVDGACVAATGSSPRFIAFDRNVGRITEGDTVRFTAVVTDPDGIDDLIGGTLRDPISGGAYGAFATAASEGAYQLEISWGEIHRVRPIQFLVEIERTFEAVFYDVAGNPASRTLTIALYCDDDNVACDGACVSLDGDDHCGACFNECPDTSTCEEQVCTCPEGEDLCGGEACLPLDTIENCLGCGIACPVGGSCTPEGCACPDGYADCDGICVDQNTVTDCGGCGLACAIGGACDGGTCVCGPGEADCGGVCESLSSRDHCGGCFEACAVGASCDGVSCNCPDGFGVCGGVCVDLTTPAECGTCDNTCPPGSLCVDGGCACPTNEQICDGACLDVTTETDCGGCGVTCPALASCVAGACTCPMGYELCDDVCVEMGTITDCGGCGLACPAGDDWSCATDLCVCQPGRTSCDGINCVNEAATSSCGDGCSTCAGTEMCAFGGCNVPVETDLRINDDGHLEIFWLGMWGTVCDFGFDDNAAAVACGQLGGTLLGYETGQAGSGLFTFLDGLVCTGDEDRLAGCVRSVWDPDTCFSGDSSVALYCDIPDVPADCEPLAHGSLLINEVMQQAVNSSDSPIAQEFVEIIGEPGMPLDGVSVVQRDGFGAFIRSWSLDGQVMPDDGYFVVGDSTVENLDLFGVSGLDNAVEDGNISIALVDCSGATIDAVAIGEWDVFGNEGAWAGELGPALPPRAGKALGRSTDAPETGSNNVDFRAWVEGTPGEPNENSIRPNELPISITNRWPTAGTSLYPPRAGCEGATTSPYNEATLRFTNTSADPITVTATSQQWTVQPGGWNEPPTTVYSVPYFGAYSSEPNPANLLLGCEQFTTSGTTATITIDVASGADIWFATYGRGAYNYTITVNEAAP